MRIKHSAFIALPLAAAALVSGCASQPIAKDFDSLVPVGTTRTQQAGSRKDQFLEKLSAEQKEAYRGLAISMGATLGAEGNPNSAVAVRILQMLGR